VLLGGVPGTLPGRVVVIGAGNSGAHAVQMAVGLGAHVTILDIDSQKLDSLDREYRGRVTTLISNPANIAYAVAAADLLVGAVLIPAARAPIVVRNEVVARMQPGSVVVDIAIDQGGCIESVVATSHQEPVYTRHDVLHYAVPNMPALVGRTSTVALTQATGPYLALLAEKGVESALAEHRGLACGLSTRNGQLTCANTARAHGLSAVGCAAAD
jgi:alanine dehydrogenase